MAEISDRHLIWCGSEDPPKGIESAYSKLHRLDAFPRQGNVRIEYRNISERLAHNFTDIAKDLLEIGSYVYCGDQTIPRGGKTLKGDGVYWRRDLHFRIPVRNKALWNNPEVKTLLCDTLSFLSDDNYSFDFVDVERDIPFEQHFDFKEENRWFEADQVMLFSGGLDSLAGLIEEVVNQKHSPILVSHRPVAKLSKRQTDLHHEFTAITSTANRVLHVPIWVNKDQGLTKDNSQRTRSFLYVCLAASVASVFGVDRIRFFENGIISCNLPFATQLVGARASRTTHPRVLEGYSSLLSKVLNKRMIVENPFLWKTKSEIVKIIKDAGLSRLVSMAGSCNHTRKTNKFSHCGVCSQCVDRRIATLHNDLDDHDNSSLYETDLFTGKLTTTEAKSMTTGYIEFANSVENASDGDFFGQYPEAMRILKHTGLSFADSAESIYDLHQRYGKQVGNVVEGRIKEFADRIRKGEIPSDSLLGMICGSRLQSDTQAIRFPTPEGATWHDVRIELLRIKAARISVGEVKKIYTAADMGFSDSRATGALTKQWDTLEDFAEGIGRISWATRQERDSLYKSIQSLKRTLQAFFGIQGDPIHPYKRREGYVTKFKIVESPDSVDESRNFENLD